MISLLDFRTVMTVWYILFFYLILELLRQSDIFCFSIWFWSCYDSLIYFVFYFISFLKLLFIHFLSQVILPWYALKIQCDLPLNNFKIKKKTTTEKFTWLNYIYFVTEFVRFLSLKVCLTIDSLGTFSINQSYTSQTFRIYI